MKKFFKLLAELIFWPLGVVSFFVIIGETPEGSSLWLLFWSKLIGFAAMGVSILVLKKVYKKEEERQ